LGITDLYEGNEYATAHNTSRSVYHALLESRHRASEVTAMRVTTIMLGITLFAGMATLDTSISKSQKSTTNKDSAIIALAGEFRTVFANLLWIKAEHYHHEYLAHNGDWVKNEDLLGLDKLITRLDPHFVEAYAAGTRMLIEQKKLEEAKAFMEEGLKNNPNSLLLHDEMGTFLARHLQEYEQGLFHLKRAYILSKDKWDKERLGRLIKTVERLAKEN
jgi:tetratricopeptide (TPR) repeat protein